MGSRSNLFISSEDELSCPVCQKGLNSQGPGPPAHKKNKTSGRREKRPSFQLYNTIYVQKETPQKFSKITKDQDDVVVAQCGHLFHKFCLRHFCYLYKE